MKKITTRLELHFDFNNSEETIQTQKLCTRIESLLEELRKDSVLSQDLGEEDSVDSIDVRVVDTAGGRYFVDVTFDVDSAIDNKKQELALSKATVDFVNEFKCGGLLSDCISDNAMLVLVTEFETKTDADFCKVCGSGFIVESGVSGHVDALGNRDYDLDADHVPYGLCG